MNQTMTNNSNSTDQNPPYDSHGAMIYIISVLSWYAIGFGLILISTICSKRDQRKFPGFSNVYQAVTDLHEYKARNDLLIELKDQDRRKKLWEIYYGVNQNPSKTMAKEKETLVSITKQLDERRRLIQNTLDDIQLDQSVNEELNITNDDRQSHEN